MVKMIGYLWKQSVNLNKLACVVFGDALQSSRYRRIQRFFSKFPLDYQQIAGFIFKLFFVSDGQWYLSMDRTNWRWGKSDINIRPLSLNIFSSASEDHKGQRGLTSISKFLSMFPA